MRDSCFCRIGGERVLLISTIAWASLTAATPVLVHLNVSPLITMTTTRFLMGLFQGNKRDRHYSDVKSPKKKQQKQVLKDNCTHMAINRLTEALYSSDFPCLNIVVNIDLI